MIHLKQLFLACAVALLAACGGGGGTTTPAPVLSVTVTGAGAANAAGWYTIPTNTTVTVTCNMSCTVTPNATVTYNNVTTTSNSWTATVSNLSAIQRTANIVASATGQTSITTSLQVGATALSNASMELLAKSGNTATASVSTAGAEASFLALKLEGLTGTGTNQNLTGNPAICSTGSYTASWVSASAISVTAGDYVSITYNNCSGYNGTAKFTFTAFPSGGRTGTIAFTNYTYTSGSNAISIPSSTLTWTSSSYNTYPVIQKLTGALTTATNTSAINLKTGSNNFIMTNISYVLNVASATVFSTAYSFSVTDVGLDSYSVSNSTPKTYTNSAVTTSGVTVINYGNASLTVTSSNTDSIITGTNANGVAISSLSLGSPYYF